MTTPETNGPGEPDRELSVSTAPPSAPRRWWSAVPHHLGRARTSTVVLALLFVGLYALYLHVRPPDPATTPTPSSTVQTPASTAPAEPEGTTEPTTAPSTTTAPSPTSTPTSPGGTVEETPPGTTAPTPTPTPTLTPTQGVPPATTRAPTPAAPTATGAPGT